MPNIVTIHDDNIDEDVLINLDDNKVIQLACLTPDLFNLLKSEITEQLVEFQDCFIFYFSVNSLLNERAQNCRKITNSHDWITELKEHTRKFRNVVLFIEMSPDSEDMYYSETTEKTTDDLEAEIYRLLKTKNEYNFTFFYFHTALSVIIEYESRHFLYGGDCLNAIKYYDGLVLAKSFLDGLNRRSKKEQEENESLSLKQTAKYFLALKEVYRQLRSGHPVPLCETQDSILRNKNYCHSDIEQILELFYHEDLDMTHLNSPSSFYCSKKSELDKAARGLIKDSEFSEVARALVFSEKKAINLIEQGKKFEEWGVFEQMVFWETAGLGVISALYRNNPAKQEYIRTSAKRLSLTQDCPSNLQSFLKKNSF